MTLEESSSKEVIFKYVLNQRSKVIQGLNNGTLSCLPEADGYADTQPAFNIVTDNIFSGINLLCLKEYQKERGFPTGEFVSTYQFAEAKQYFPDDFALKPGEKSVTLHFSELNKNTGKTENYSADFYNVAQFHDPEKLIEYALTERYGNSYMEYSPPAHLNGTGPTIVCKSTKPTEYLGQYYAAVSLGGKFRVSPEQAKEFSQNMETSLSMNLGGEHPFPFTLTNISNNAREYSKEVIREINSPKVAQEQKKKQEQKQERKKGRSR